MDEKAFVGVTENAKRNRRILSMVMVVTGAIADAFMTKGGDLNLLSGQLPESNFAWPVFG